MVQTRVAALWALRCSVRPGPVGGRLAKCDTHRPGFLVSGPEV